MAGRRGLAGSKRKAAQQAATRQEARTVPGQDASWGSDDSEASTCSSSAECSVPSPPTVSLQKRPRGACQGGCAACTSALCAAAALPAVGQAGQPVWNPSYGEAQLLQPPARLLRITITSGPYVGFSRLVRLATDGGCAPGLAPWSPAHAAPPGSWSAPGLGARSPPFYPWLAPPAAGTQPPSRIQGTVQQDNGEQEATSVLRPPTWPGLGTTPAGSLNLYASGGLTVPGIPVAPPAALLPHVVVGVPVAPSVPHPTLQPWQIYMPAIQAALERQGAGLQLVRA